MHKLLSGYYFKVLRPVNCEYTTHGGGKFNDSASTTCHFNCSSRAQWSRRVTSGVATAQPLELAQSESTRYFVGGGAHLMLYHVSWHHDSPAERCGDATLPTARPG